MNLPSNRVAGLICTVVFALLVTGCSGDQPLAVPPSDDAALLLDRGDQEQVALPLSDPPADLRFEHISLGPEFSESEVYRMLQDSAGFMWFGTEDGLVRYDGYGLTVYRHEADDPDSLRDDSITAIYEDRAGVLWVGTEAGWLERYDRVGGGFAHYSTSAGVISVFEDRERVLWVGTSEALFVFDRDQERFTRARAVSVSSIHQDRDGVIWIGTAEGIDRYDPSTGVLWEDRYDLGLVTRYDTRGSEGLSDDFVWTIYEDEPGTLWFGTDGGGVNRLDPGSDRFHVYAHAPDDPNSLGEGAVPSIVADQLGALWVATYGGGLNRLDPNTGQITHYQHDDADSYSLSSDYVISVFVDRAGLIWVGMEDGQVDTLNLRQGYFGHHQHVPGDDGSLGQGSVAAIYEDASGAVWVGTSGGGLNRWDLELEEWQHYRHDPQVVGSLSGDGVRSIYQSPEGDLWIGTDSGLDVYDPERDRFTHFPLGAVDAMLVDRAGNAWIAANASLLECEASLENCVLMRRGRYALGQIVEDRDGGLWIGTDGEGLLHYEGDGFVAYKPVPGDPNSLSSVTVWSIYEDEDGVLWLATDSGLNRYDPNAGVFESYTEMDGLVSDEVRGVLGDEQGLIWVSTDRGLARFDPQRETFTRFDVVDGLQDDDFTARAFFRTSDGEIFFGGIKGLNSFRPEQVRLNEQPPPVVVTTVYLFNEAVRTDLLPGERIELAHDENMLSFEFAALDYEDPARNRYAFRLEGYDSDWVDAGTNRRADYARIPPGEYVFRVRGSNSDGVWNMEGTSIGVSIKLPLWRVWWFQGLVVLALAGGLVGAYWLRVRSVEARAQELEVLVEERTAELERELELRLQAEEALRQSELERAVDDERNRLARELHDAVTQTLFSSSMMAQALPAAWAMDQEEGQRLLEDLRLLNKGALAEMRTLLLELRPAALTETELGDLLRQLADAVGGREGLPVDVEIGGGYRLPPDVHIAFYRIAQEALNNVVKHARAERVGVTLRCYPASSESPAKVVLAVEDDGLGFSPETVSGDRLGLGIMGERADAVGAALEIDSHPGQGTRVELTWVEEGGRG